MITDWQGYGLQKQRALELATMDWVLNIDADETVSEHLKQEIYHAMQKNSADAYRIAIHLNFYGKPLYYSWSPKRHIRLFKRQNAKYNDNIVHEAINLPAKTKIGQMHSPILHHSFQDISHALYKLNHVETNVPRVLETVRLR